MTNPKSIQRTGQIKWSARVPLTANMGDTNNSKCGLFLFQVQKQRPKQLCIWEASKEKYTREDNKK